MALKHLTRIGDIYIDDDGNEVEPLSRFKQFLDQRGNSGTSKKRYLYAAARFVDYLIECRVFGEAALPARISDAMNVYPLFLRDGVRIEAPEFTSLSAYAAEIGFVHGLAKRSFAPTIAAVNLFLRLAHDEGLKAISALAQEGIWVDLLNLEMTFSAIEGVVRWSRNEKDRFRQQAMIGGVVRIQDELVRPRGLRNPKHSGVQRDLESKEFPLAHLADLLAAANTSRDRALWALLAGGGLRLHEALNIQLSDFDVETGTVWVIDPDMRRFAGQMEDEDKKRFKGRLVSRVYLYEPLRTIFWEALRDYLRNEFIPSGTGNQDYLFKILGGSRRGKPLKDASDTAHGKQFKAAVRRAKVPGPPEAPDHVWTLHSLRHSYGVYMHNYIPVPGGPGLRLTEVQMLMGHADPRSTAIYARKDRLIVEAMIEAADDIVFNGKDPAMAELDRLPATIAARLRRAAEEIEARMQGKTGRVQCHLP
ncbi:tyrosine-type recombinase/integrase [Microvirga guangxiensis]|uniref:Phage integrase family protein n=1 Tax=Microvirga guangxiensis TaxID=549386 RepID=A0A1G5HPB9_9HYPH|nr:site-specific integrase [Microvirga guangxiensis]SCY65531.1 Phage integrase family protein [Microvirga guangxiensis]